MRGACGFPLCQWMYYIHCLVLSQLSIAGRIPPPVNSPYVLWVVSQGWAEGSCLRVRVLSSGFLCWMFLVWCQGYLGFVWCFSHDLTGKGVYGQHDLSLSMPPPPCPCPMSGSLPGRTGGVAIRIVPLDQSAPLHRRPASVPQLLLLILGSCPCAFVLWVIIQHFIDLVALIALAIGSSLIWLLHTSHPPILWVLGILLFCLVFFYHFFFFWCQKTFQAHPEHFLPSGNQPFPPGAQVLYWRKVSGTKPWALVGSLPWGVGAARPPQWTAWPCLCTEQYLYVSVNTYHGHFMPYSPAPASGPLPRLCPVHRSVSAGEAEGQDTHWPLQSVTVCLPLVASVLRGPDRLLTFIQFFTFEG